MKNLSKNPKAQIVATLGPASSNEHTLKAMIESGLDVARLNFSWSDIKGHTAQIELVRKLERELKRRIPVIIDLPGPRVQEKEGHTYNHHVTHSITKQDEEFIQFAAVTGVEYVAVSFVGKADDITRCRQLIEKNRGTQKIIAKIERKVALESLDEIIAASDAVMVARGDLGNEVPLEQIPFIQDKIVEKAKTAGKPVIVATQMMLSMMDNPTPTRAEVTDVENAVFQGADAVMLSEESAEGKYPVESVAMMEKIIEETERHMVGREKLNLL
jgi:pyruvate kinase